MIRRVKSVFVADIACQELSPTGLEYYIEASDGNNTAVFPASSPAMPLSLVATDSRDQTPPGRPGELAVKDQTLHWSPATGDVFSYRIYRGSNPDFSPGPATLLTYVDKSTTRFKDGAAGFDGQPLRGVWYYRVSAVDFAGNEGPAAPAVRSRFPEKGQPTPE